MNNVVMLRGMFCVYLVTNKISGKVYVGKTGKPLRTRWIQHLSASRIAKKREWSRPLCAAIRKYGQDAFTIEPIEWCANDGESYKAEAFWVDWYRATDSSIGYNASAGGIGSPGHKSSEKQKAVASATFKGVPHSLEFVAKRVAGRIGMTPDEYAAKRLAGERYCPGYGRAPHWLPAFSFNRTSGSCRNCYNAARRAKRPDVPRVYKRGFKQSDEWTAKRIATRMGIPLEEYVGNTRSGLKRCYGCHVRDAHWLEPEAFSPGCSACRECKREFMRHRKRKAA